MALADTLLTLLFAPRCAACDAPLDAPSAGPVCPACWALVTPLGPAVCPRCGDTLDPHPPQAPVLERRRDLPARGCLRCHHRPDVIARAAAAAAYEPTLRRIVHALKYDGRRSLAGPLARLLVERCGALLEDAACLVPVPLHPLRRLTRGFNQALDLAQGMSRLTSCGPALGALARGRRTRPQEGLTVDARRRRLQALPAAHGAHARGLRRGTGRRAGG